MKIKRSFALLVALLLSLSFASCGNMPKEGSGDNIVVTEDGEMVNISLPASFMNGASEKEIKAAAKEQGITKTVVYDDGSVTYRMSKATQRKILSDMVAKIDQDAESYISGENSYPAFLRIKHDDEIKNFTVYVDPTLYSDELVGTAMYFYVMGSYYQAFAGVKQEEIDVLVSFVDNETGDTLYALSYQEWIAMQE